MTGEMESIVNGECIIVYSYTCHLNKIRHKIGTKSILNKVINAETHVGPFLYDRNM